MLRYTVLLTATLCVALFAVIAGDEKLIPQIAGGISQPHDCLKTHCQACHEPWRGPIRERCLDCHVFRAIDARAAGGEGGIATQSPTSGQGPVGHEPLNCADCHHEHMGLSQLVKADYSVTRTHILWDPKLPQCGTCLNCHLDVDHGKKLGCAFGLDCHPGADLTKTSKKGAHARMMPR